MNFVERLSEHDNDVFITLENAQIANCIKELESVKKELTFTKERLYEERDTWDRMLSNASVRFESQIEELKRELKFSQMAANAEAKHADGLHEEIIGFKIDIEKIKKQRDELLTAMTVARESLDDIKLRDWKSGRENFRDAYISAKETIEVIDAAIARVKGGAA